MAEANLNLLVGQEVETAKTVLMLCGAAGDTGLQRLWIRVRPDPRLGPEDATLSVELTEEPPNGTKVRLCYNILERLQEETPALRLVVQVKGGHQTYAQTLFAPR